MEEMIIKKLKEVAGLSEEQAKKAAEVVMGIISGGGEDGEGGGLAGKLAGMAGGLGGMFGGDKNEE